MKKTLLSLTASLLLLSSVTRAQIIQNGDFENVSICIASGSVLPYWADNDCNDTGVRPTSDARNGYTALLLDNRLQTTRQRAVNSESLAPGPLPTQMTFNWKAQMILSDTVYANVYTKCNSGGGWLKMGGWRYIDSLGMNPGWHQASVPIAGVSPFCFDSIRVELLGGNKVNMVSDGTKFFVDDISFNFVPVGLNEPHDQSLHAVAFPNPANETLNLRLAGESGRMASLRIHTLAGQVCMSQELRIEQDHIQVSTAELANGMYIVSLQINNKHYIQKLTVNH